MVSFPVWIIPFPVNENPFGIVGPHRELLLKKFVDPMAGSGINNSI